MQISNISGYQEILADSFLCYIIISKDILCYNIDKS